jgi:hypothetical protein
MPQELKVPKFNPKDDEIFDPNLTEEDIDRDAVRQLHLLQDLEGFFARKVKYKIESVHDFVIKMQQNQLRILS